MFYITVSNGLLKDGHRKRIGTAVWEFMWIIDKVTKIDEKGIGWVLGGKPIKLEEMCDGVDQDTVSRNLNKLEDEGYIKKTRTPYGIKIFVMKMKKGFGRNAVSRNRKSAVSLRENAVSNKTVQLDNNNKEAEQSTAEVHVEVAFKEKNGAMIPEVIKAFEVLNPAVKRFYGNKTQRTACDTLIEEYGFVKVKDVIEKALPKTNPLPYFPTITTPLQLLEKWSALEIAITKHNSRKTQQKQKQGAAHW